ncbi:protein phosphatase inhibitor 2 [Dermatophagoides farinae]|uniref:protein phosphatase inhibitor 2 n=1 Tax=Dermatophagoides farinae TaxID=6954 RepID=UPI003F629FE6
METTENFSKPIENLSKKPAKGILKSTSSSEHQPPQLNRQNSQDKDIKWDETNILQTLHPPDKDYGHMKIEEPKTPYSYFVEDDDGQCHSDNEMVGEIDPENLAKLIDKTTSSKSKFTFDAMEQDDSDQSDFEEIENETEEERMRRKEFEQKRKKHYNEYQMVKLARKLMKDEMNEDDHDDDDDE